MATIIEFRQTGVRDTFEPRRTERTGTAEIVMFPGVRVEYWSDEAPVYEQTRYEQTGYEQGGEPLGGSRRDS